MADQIDRYGEAIEYDLRRELGIDLLEYFLPEKPPARTWRQLAGFIRRLPSGGQYWAAMASDDERAEHWVLTHPDEPPAGEPPLTTMTDTNQMITEVIVQLDRLVCQEVSLGGESLDPSPPKRPTTAMERARKHARTIRHNSLVSEVRAAQVRWAAMQENNKT